MKGPAGRKSPEQRVAEANAAAGQGRHGAAADIFRSLIRDHPKIAELHFNLGNALKGLGNQAGAERAFRQAIALKPTLVEAHYNLANTCQEQARHQEAADAFTAVLAHDDRHLGALFNAAQLMQDRKNEAGSLVLLRRVLCLQPDRPGAASLLGLAAKATGDYAAAGRWLRRAAAFDPGHPAAWTNLGDLARLESRFGDALAHYRTALLLEPGHPHALTNLGLMLYEMQAPQPAARLHDQALRVDPAVPQARWNRALAALALGDLATGWPFYEARFPAAACPGRPFDIPAWEGGSLAGRRLLLWREQGIGDELTWATCFPDILALGDCIIECEPRLVSLFARSFPRARVCAETAERSPADADCQLPMGSLPLHFRPTLAAFPRERVLTPRPDLIDKWRDRVAALGPGLKIGLSWRSMRTRQNQNVSHHYARLADWAALFALPGVQIVSLQYDDDPAERAEWPLRVWPDLDLRNDFEDVAALVDVLDGVITVSNTVAALAGCLARPTLEMALAQSWSFLAADRSPWFGANQAVFRTAEDADWSRPIERAVAEIERWRRTPPAGIR